MRKLLKIVNKRIELLQNSKQSFKDIFQCIHYQEENTFCEYLNDYKIHKITYKEAKELSIQMGNYFSKHITLEKGSYVGLMMENRKEWIFSFWGLLMAGYKPVLFNVKLGPSLNKDVIELLKVKTIISDKDVNLVENVINIEKIHLESTNKSMDVFSWENEIALTSSATTLNVKVCIYKGQNIAQQILDTKGIIRKNKLIMTHYNGELKHLAFLPFYHVFGLIAMYFWFAFFSRTFVFLKDYSTDTILNTIKRHKVTHLFAVPLLWHGVNKEINKELEKRGEKTKKRFERAVSFSLFIQSIFPRFGIRLAKRMFKEIQAKLFGDSLTFLITGGSYISPEAIRIINAIGYPLFNGYGMSEIGITSVELRLRANKRIRASIGSPFESVSYKIEDKILFVKGASLAYKTISKEGTKEITPSTWFNTKDISTKNRKHYFLLGREDDIVVSSNGEKNNPDMIEKALAFKSINRFSVIGIKENTTQYLALIVELDDNFHELMKSEVIAEIEKNLERLQQNNYYIEKVYITFDRIALPQAIKVSRTILKHSIEAGNVELITLHDFKTNDLTTEELNQLITTEIIEIIVEILNKDKKEIRLNSHLIFDLGASSLDYITLLMRLKIKYNVDFNLNEDGNLDTVRKLSNYILRNRKKG